MTISKLAEQINQYCQDKDYFWAAGLIRETLALWRDVNNYAILNHVAQIIVDTYSNKLKLK